MKEWIEQQLGESVLEITPTENGSGATYVICTLQGRYIAKRGERQDFLALYRKIQPELAGAGLKQSQILGHNEQIVLYEWLEGITCRTLTPEKIKNAILYIRDYFDVLRRIPIENIALSRMNVWDDAKSLQFLLDEFPKMDQYSSVPCIAAAVDRLSKTRKLVEKLPIQLIHGDLGGDNFLFLGDKVNSIIDFTPEIASDMYGLCQFLYWNVLWQEESARSLHTWSRMYSEQLNEEIFDFFMLQAALFRVVGPLLNGSSNLMKRIMLLEILLKPG